MKKIDFNGDYSDAEPDYFDGDRKCITEKVIRLYMHGKVSEEIMQEFLTWLADESHSDEKDAALFRLWNEIEKRAKRSTFVSLKKTNFRLDGVPNKRSLSPGTVFFRVAAVLLPFIAAAGVYFWLNREEQGVQMATLTRTTKVEITVPNGSTKQITLPDGSNVRIKGGSTVGYDEGFSGARGVTLDGEAFFDVTGSDVPFVVTSAHSSVKVLGTKFNVEDYRDDHDVVVSLESGSLETTVGGVAYMMNTGDELCYDILSAGVTMRKLEGNYDMSKNILAFSRDNLDGIFRKVERHFGCMVTVDGPRTDNSLYSTYFEEGESLDVVLDVVQKLSKKFSYEIDGNTVMIKVN